MSIDLRNIELGTAAKPAKERSSISELLNRDIQLFGSRFNDKKKERFYSELLVLFAAGVDIKTAFELIEEEQTKSKDIALFASIRERIVEGGSLSVALQEAKVFSPYEYYSLKIGEESGRINEVLTELASFFAKKIKQRRQITSALAYPVIVLLTALGAVFFMLRFVVPMFQEVFNRFGGDLPGITKVVIAISKGMEGSFTVVALIAVALVAIGITQKKKAWYRKITAAISLKLPLVGSMMQKIYLARFCHSMNLLTGANTPLVEALGLVRKMIGFYPIEQATEKIREQVIQGVPFHKALAEFPIFNKRMVSLIKVAEEVNQLDIIFDKLAKQYTDEVEHQSSLLSSVLEPILIVFIGLMVAFILVAMYLPMFQLSTMIG